MKDANHLILLRLGSRFWQKIQSSILLKVRYSIDPSINKIGFDLDSYLFSRIYSSIGSIIYVRFGSTIRSNVYLQVRSQNKMINDEA